MPPIPNVSPLRASLTGAAVVTLVLLLVPAAGSVGAATRADRIGSVAPRRAAGPYVAGAKEQQRSLVLEIHRAAPPSGYSTFANSGAATLKISVVTDDGGDLVDGRPRVAARNDRAVRYPKHTSDVQAPHAIIQIIDRRGADDLSPGSRPFRFGADFILDKVSEDAHHGGRDNGDNVLQRGRYNQRAQYKVQIDHRVPSCRVKGSRGAVSVASSLRPIRPGNWYRVRCTRNHGRLTIVMTTWGSGGPRQVRDSATGAIGLVSAPRRAAPVSVGGKLARRGVIDQAADQFNGRIDNVVFRIG